MENNATPKLKEFAQRLLREEIVGNPAGEKGSAAFRVCEKLRASLGRFMGTRGFRALLARALALAGAEVPWLRSLELQEDGSLKGLKELEGTHDQDAIDAGEIVLVAHLLGLLVIFVGPALTLGLVQEAWPKAPLNDLKFGSGEKQ